MRPKDMDYLSTEEAARALGVSISTVKRWVDDGLLPAHKTAGGHRKLLLTDVQALGRTTDLPRRDLAGRSAGLPPQGTPDLGLLRIDLSRFLLDGSGADVSRLLLRAFDFGVSVADMGDRLIAPVMREIGHGWETGRLQIWHEHRATLLIAGALYELAAVLQARALRDRPIALGGAPESDPYVMPSLLAQLTLLDNGWQAVNLGPNTPFATLLDCVRLLKPKMVWLSATYLPSVERFVQEANELFGELEDARVPLAIGGQALASPIRGSLRYTTHGDGLGHLAAFAATLEPRPRRPRRGRPPKGNK